MDSLERSESDWPSGARFYLTLDFECDFGTALERNTYRAIESVDLLVDLLDGMGVPLTCFVQTEVLDVAPERVDALAGLDEVSFHPHSHTHRPREETDVSVEIRTSTERYRDFFGDSPSGYRLPNGNVRIDDYRTLAEHGYGFDASLFPSWRPRHFDNTDAPTRPHRYPSLDLFEIPFTVYSETARVPTALSYCRVLGRPFTWLLSRCPPRVVVFNIHMHDLVTPPTYADLPHVYRALYARNDHGFDLLARMLSTFDDLDYEFGTIDELHGELEDSAPSTYSR